MMQTPTTSIREEENKLLRLVVYTSRANQPLPENPPCRVLLASETSRICELWTWFSTPDQFLSLVERLLNRGFLPLTLATLNGEIISFSSLTLEPREIIELGSRTISITGVITGEILFENIHSITSLLHEISLNRLYVDMKKRIIQIELVKPVNTKLLYDSLIRITKPVKIPPKTRENRKRK